MLCPVTGIKINADLNAARNIAKKAGYETPTPKKILSFITTNSVKTINPHGWGNN
jgi:transposase